MICTQQQTYEGSVVQSALIWDSGDLGSWVYSCQLLAMWPWAGIFSSLSLNFFICINKMLGYNDLESPF